MKRFLSLLALCALLLGGCSAENPLPVSAAALSRTKDGYRMTAELIRQDSLDGDAAPVYLSAEGRDLPSLFSEAERRLGGHFYFSHAETILLDGSLMREGVGELAAWLAERPDARLTLRLVVARDTPAEELLQLDALGEAIPGVALYELLEGLAARGDIPDMPLYKVQNALVQGETIRLPFLFQTEDEHTAAGGAAILENGVLTGFLPTEDSRQLPYLAVDGPGITDKTAASAVPPKEDAHG